MDQAISVLGRARLVEFDPVRTSPVRLPEEAVFVVANSLTVAEKAVAAHLYYNKRVVEMMLACKLLARATALPDFLRYRTFSQVQTGLSERRGREVSFAEMQDLARTHLEREEYAESDLGAVLEGAWEEWFPHANDDEQSRIAQVRESASSYVLRARALHVYAEAERVWKFQRACAEGASLTVLGGLMNESQHSCDTLYDCSCPELNQLTKTCREMGAYGSRLTGAGWGGSTVSLVDATKVDAFIEELRLRYYASVPQAKEHEWQDICFTAVPTPGATVYVPSRKTMNP